MNEGFMFRTSLPERLDKLTDIGKKNSFLLSVLLVFVLFKRLDHYQFHVHPFSPLLFHRAISSNNTAFDHRLMLLIVFLLYHPCFVASKRSTSGVFVKTKVIALTLRRDANPKTV